MLSPERGKGGRAVKVESCIFQLVQVRTEHHQVSRSGKQRRILSIHLLSCHSVQGTDNTTVNKTDKITSLMFTCHRQEEKCHFNCLISVK